MPGPLIRTSRYWWPRQVERPSSGELPRTCTFRKASCSAAFEASRLTAIRPRASAFIFVTASSVSSGVALGVSDGSRPFMRAYWRTANRSPSARAVPARRTREAARPPTREGTKVERAEGSVDESDSRDEPQYTIWIKTWGQIIDDCKESGES